jgi:hypothetical protein
LPYTESYHAAQFYHWCWGRFWFRMISCRITAVSVFWFVENYAIEVSLAYFWVWLQDPVTNTFPIFNLFSPIFSVP